MTQSIPQLPELPRNLPNVTRRIRACESEVPAQLVLEHAMLEYALAALAAQPLVGVIPEGMALVPQKATREMLNAAIDVDSFKLGDISPLGFRMSPQQLFELCYAAMLAAAPKYPVGLQDITEPMVKCRWEEIKPGLGRFVPVDEFDIESLSDGDAAAQGAAREPLTLREIAEATTKQAHVRSDHVIEIARAIEAAHGIGHSTQGVDHG